MRGGGWFAVLQTAESKSLYPFWLGVVSIATVFFSVFCQEFAFFGIFLGLFKPGFERCVHMIERGVNSK